MTTSTQTAVVRQTEAVIRVDCDPPPEVSPNWRGHWSEKAGSVRMFRAFACIGTNRVHSHVLHVVASASVVVMDVEIQWSGRRKIHDDDNAWAMLKPARDGIADALGIDDKMFRQGELRQMRGKGITIITLRSESDTL